MLTALLLSLATLLPNPPTVNLTADHTKIAQSCIIHIAPGTVIADADGDGVIEVDADNITIEFDQGSLLKGAATGTGPNQVPWDQLTGCAIRINNHKNVTLKNLSISGYKVGVHATTADGLKIESADIHDGFRQHLKSTPQAEDQADWLWPHANDAHEWVTNYGAAVCVEDSTNVTVHDLAVRRSQNGIILDRVSHASIYDNDCSFLSGWGLAMWRSCDNTIARNALDFCVRGSQRRHLQPGPGLRRHPLLRAVQPQHLQRKLRHPQRRRLLRLCRQGSHRRTPLQRPPLRLHQGRLQRQRHHQQRLLLLPRPRP